jgi:hypothetical protein
MELKFYVNHKTRMCRVLQGSTQNPEHLANLADAEKQGFVEVTGPEQDAFRAETKKAVDAGWKPAGRTSYARFMEVHEGEE